MGKDSDEGSTAHIENAREMHDAEEKRERGSRRMTGSCVWIKRRRVSRQLSMIKKR